MSAPGPARRKLIAVLYADMVGYSRLIGLDDAGTLERLRALRRDLIDPAIQEYDGRIVQTGGDSLLMVFDSIDGAVQCAVKVQSQVPIVDGDQPTDRTIRFRVGINIGDAIADGTDLHGDAVNVAARLQAECPPGGICVSRSVRDHVHGRLDLAFEALGALELKNISRPVEAFVLRSSATAKSVERTLVHGTGDVLPLPDRPSIAVLAFTNMSGDPEQEYFSDGIADDIITELSRSRSLFVIARNSSFTYKGHAIDIKQVVRELGVRYVLEGSVRRSGDRVRVVGQLIDAESGNHIWAERYDRLLNDVFAVQDDITMSVVTAIQPAMADAERRRVMRKSPESLGCWEAYQRGLWHMAKANPDGNDQAKLFLQRAIELDRMFAPAYAAMAGACMNDGLVFGTVSLQDTAERTVEWARKAVELDPDDAGARVMLAWTMAIQGTSRAVWEVISLAVAINSNSSLANGVKGAFLLFNGQPSEAREALLTALRLDPRGPTSAVPLTQVAVSYYFERDYPQALEAAQRAVSRYPEFPLVYRYLAAILGQLGRTEEAHDALETALRLSRGSFELHVHNRPPWWQAEDYEHMLEGLFKAGWQG
jgi:adenylate cyclase